MSVIRISESIQFVIGAHRAEYAQMKSKQFDRVLSENSSVYGNYHRIIKNPNESRIVAYSHDDGIATGEYVISCLPQENLTNSIYVEELNDIDGATRYICIVIIDGKVVVDVEYSQSEDSGNDNEDLILALDQNQDAVFTIFTAGKLNLISNESGDKPLLFSISDHRVGEKITVIPILRNARERDLDGFRYQSYELNQKYNKFNSSKQNLSGNSKNGKLYAQIAFVLIGIGIILWMVFPREKNQDVAPNPYAGYEAALAGLVSPVDVLNKVIKLVYFSEVIDGWVLEKGHFESGLFQIRFLNAGGDITSFLPIKDEFGSFDTASDATVFVVTGAAQPAERSFPYVIYKFKEIEYLLYKQVVIDSEVNFSISAEVDNGFYFQRQYKVEIKDAQIYDLQRFAIFLVDKPIVVNRVEFSPANIGHDVSISITIFGEM